MTIGERITTLEKRVQRIEISAALLLMLFGSSALFGGVLQSTTTAAPAYLIELADYGEPTRFELWATPLDSAGQRRRISQQTSGQGWDVATGFIVIRNGSRWRAVYVLSQIAYGVHDLYAVNVDGGSPSLVHRLVLPGFVKFGPDEVTFSAEVVAGGAAKWWIVDTVTREREVLFADGFESGNTGRWR